MRDRALILGGLAVAVAAVTWPVWRAAASVPAHPPELARPASAVRCVAPVEEMRASHMTLLVAWRDRVVRDGVRTYTDADGRVVTMSLTKTCLGACHADKTAFCDRCHTFAGVTPTCWNCHVAAKAAPSTGVRP